ncbi:uncharacterized protein YALI1_C12686g [Yarrowia lipolytica]|uniref:Uncharacterized protein n=1 Tax=Yarrowia lipolytica TaxID=4952 RepID=A0A1D8NAB4_YARLL|nr:hypothetical protein YALI1_C12686g [Yarrowia lipolytica]
MEDIDHVTDRKLNSSRDSNSRSQPSPAERRITQTPTAAHGAQEPTFGRQALSEINTCTANPFKRSLHRHPAPIATQLLWTIHFDISAAQATVLRPTTTISVSVLQSQFHLTISSDILPNERTTRIQPEFILTTDQGPINSPGAVQQLESQKPNRQLFFASRLIYNYAIN